MTRPSDPYDWTAWAWTVIHDLGEEIPASAGLVLLALAAHANASGLARPSARRLAAEYLGRNDRVVRRAFAQLEAQHVIRATGTHNRVVIWQLGADPLSAPDTPGGADPVSAPVRRECGASADPVSAEGEGEENISLTPYVAKDARAREGDHLEQVIPFQRMAAGGHLV